jgi:prephenate dehydrogenase
MRIGIVGVGLIGGSVALASRARLGAHTIGFDPDQDATALAVTAGALDAAADSVAAAVTDAEVVFVAAPVGRLPALVDEVLAHAPDGCAVTDVGSTKRTLAASHADQRFIGGHPLAGAETSGIAHARANLFDGATWYLTPTTTTSGILYERLHRLLAGIGARPVAIDPQRHDLLMAAVSHLPHVLANVLVAQAAHSLGGERLPAIGPSFRDATRVAGANPVIWTDIYLSNRDALIEQIDGAVTHLQQFRAALAEADADAVAAAANAAAADHRALQASQVAGGELHELRIPVPNRPGVVAELALALGRGGVNIADLGLYPAADMRDGVVAVWIAGTEATAQALNIVETLGFQVFSP